MRGDLLGRGDSYNLLNVVTVLHGLIPQKDWRPLLGEHWSGAENVYKYTPKTGLRPEQQRQVYSEGVTMCATNSVKELLVS